MAAMVASGFAGWWLTRSAIPPAAPAVPASLPKPRTALHDPAPLPSKLGKRETAIVRDSAASEAGALQNQRSLVFSDRDALDRFLDAAKGKGIAILGRIDRLNALHVGFLSLDELDSLLDGSEEADYVYPVNLPTPRTETEQDGVIGFGDNLLSWLGITGDNSNYGDGPTIAILDTGSTLPDARNVFLVDPPEDPADWNGHGTAVADLIRQIAPSSDLYSWRIANDEGRSNSFLLSQGILAAVDSGVDIINISMGSYGNSALLRSAVEVARDAGIVIFASAGNEGYDQVAYPAAYEGVVSVGAVDANGQHLNFSNSGKVSMSAPGLDLVTAWTGGQRVYFSGTSASAPIAAGALAAAMSTGSTRISSSQAYERLSANFNEAGAPGYDADYGGGIIDFGRFMRAGTPGITDAAVASNYVSSSSNGRHQVQVTIENRGTEPLINAPVNINTSSGTTTVYVNTLQAGGTTTFTVPLNLVEGGATISSSIQLSGGASDLKPSNNVRTDVYTPPASN